MWFYTGAGEPSTPVGVTVSQISPNGFVVHWTVSSIVYTPETYVVEYGTTSDFLLPAAESVSSGDDIGVTDKTYSIELKDLRPGTKYYFVVAARNSARITRIEPLFIYIKETGKIFTEVLKGMWQYITALFRNSKLSNRG